MMMWVALPSVAHVACDRVSGEYPLACLDSVGDKIEASQVSTSMAYRKLVRRRVISR